MLFAFYIKKSAIVNVMPLYLFIIVAYGYDLWRTVLQRVVVA